MAWLAGWTYRKSVTLSRASGAVTNYQIKLLVGESSGATGEEVDCNSHITADFNDLRFTNSDGTTLLDYWIEAITGSTPNRLATVWIEFDSIGTGATTFYMYYGKSGASAVTSGANTFIVFDDFERGADGDAVGGSWTDTNCKISTDHAWGGTRSMKLVGGSTTPTCQIAVTASANIACQCRVWKENASGLNYMVLYGGGWITYTMNRSAEQIDYYDTGYRNVGTSTKDEWVHFENRNFDFASAHTFDMEYNSSLLKTGAVMNHPGAGDNIMQFFTYDAAGVDSYIDNLIVRNWRSTGPAWGSWAAEETAITGNPYYFSQQ